MREVYTVTMAPKDGGEPVADNGKYILIVARQADRCWKISRTTYSSDNPPQGS
ncbi:MAG: hypothetical protein ACE5HV_01935 [Acidobacteriota bacterium]